MNADFLTEKYKLGIIIFDLDGTLIDSMPSHAVAFSQVLQQTYSIPPDDGQREYIATSGYPLTSQFARALSLYGYQAEEPVLRELVRKFWKQLSGYKFELFPSTFKVISQVCKAGYGLAVSSGSSPDLVISKLQYTRISEFFSVALGSDYDHQQIMKGPQHIAAIKKYFAMPDPAFQENALFVGDGLYDMELARESGLKAVGISRDGNEKNLIAAGANLIIHTMAELSDLLTARDRRSFLPISGLHLSAPS